MDLEMFPYQEMGKETNHPRQPRLEKLNEQPIMGETMGIDQDNRSLFKFKQLQGLHIPVGMKMDVQPSLHSLQTVSS